MIVDEQIEALEATISQKVIIKLLSLKEMVRMLLFNNAAFLTTDNQIKIYTDGHANLMHY